MMFRSFVNRIVLVCILVLTPTVLVADDTVTRQEVENLATDFESMFQALLGSNEIEPVYTEYGGGLYSLSFPMPEDFGRDLENKAANFQLLAGGMQLTDPSSVSAMIHAALSDQRFDYNYWWALANSSSQNRTSTSIIRKAGPGRTFNRSFRLTYPSRTVQIFWYNPGWGVGRSGVQSFIAKVSGAGPQVVVRSYSQ